MYEKGQGVQTAAVDKGLTDRSVFKFLIVTIIITDQPTDKVSWPVSCNTKKSRIELRHLPWSIWDFYSMEWFLMYMFD